MRPLTPGPRPICMINSFHTLSYGAKIIDRRSGAPECPVCSTLATIYGQRSDVCVVVVVFFFVLYWAQTRAPHKVFSVNAIVMHMRTRRRIAEERSAFSKS